MNLNRALIQKTKKNFIVYSLIGIALIVIFSVLAVRYHNGIVTQQKSINKLFNKLGSHLKSNDTKMDGFFSDIKSSNNLSKKVIEEKFEDLNSKLDYNEALLFLWLKENGYPDVRSYKDILDFLNKKTAKDTENLFGLLNRTGTFLILLCLLQIILVWLMVFKPLYSTILYQQKNLTDALIEANAANRSKTDFIANISHEIRTPMTAILGYADLLKNKKAKAEDVENAIVTINKNASHLLSLIDEILDLSKIEVGQFDVDRKEFSLVKLLDEVHSLMSLKAEAKNVNLIFKGRGKTPALIESDPTRLKQILFNIVGNAVKFTDKGEVKLEYSFDEDKSKMIFTVKDTGRGMSRSQMKKLFKPFEQGDSTVSRKHGGTGLGLVLSRNLARNMGGDVLILSTKENVGTVFEINIDITSFSYKEYSPYQSKVLPDERESGKELEGAKILVVDDAVENTRLFQVYLKQEGALAEVAFGGEEALEKCKSTSFDLILLDLQMPGKDGYQVIKELREQSFQAPILALTAHAMDEERIKTKEAGFSAHLVKPVQKEELVRSIREFLG